ncbi:MAG: pyridoxal phosphate-dependent aminotransferase [Rhodocyclaceae bacterium]|nr:pyridoxal phosphate-dependent aminotransferase [Rhodocyclaceae bacterium]MBX3670564.1 pyridoxal phosphate-dependent aminotransferase [Rhodocyclaceae bacterium]
MPHFPAPIASRLPAVGTTIFTVMSRLAAECGAINLSQGYPDFNAEDALFEAVAHHMRGNRNQYAPMAGTPELRAAIRAKVLASYGTDYDAEQEITVTAGATQAIFTAVTALVHAGDEVIVFEPVYDSYVPAITLCGATPVYARLDAPHFRPDWEAVARLITPKTRMIMINTPHNPTASAWRAEDMQKLAELTANTSIVVLSDEVYEHIVFDGHRHESVARTPGLAERSVIVSSFGKTFHVTGWKVGYALAPAELMAEFRKVHQFNVFTVNTPVQLGLADYLAEPRRYLDLPAFYQAKRDFFRAGLAASRFELLPAAGTYFQLARYGAISAEDDHAFARRLTREHRVAAIPLSAFYRAAGQDRIVRFCFAKNESTLAEACARLCKI